MTRLAASIILLLFETVAGCAQSRASSSLPVLRFAEQVRTLSPDEANRGYPVQLRGVVTYCDPSNGDLFVQDSTAGIYVNDPNLTSSFKPGDQLEIRGETEDPDFAPQIGKPQYQLIGLAPLPEAHPASFDSLVSTREDSQWVQFDAIVRSAVSSGGHLALDLVGGGGHLKAYVLNDAGIDASRLVDATVRIEGVCTAIFNAKHQLLGVQINVPSASQLEVLIASPSDPFSQPVRAISDLMVFTPRGDTEHRIRVQGTVSLVRRRGVFIQDGAQGLLLSGARQEGLRPGDRVDVAGFADIGEYTPVLQQSIIRRIGSALLPAPAEITARQALSGAFDAVRVRLDGTVRDQRPSETDRDLLLQDGDVMFEVRLDQSRAPGDWSNLAPGSRVRVTGVCSVSVDRDRTPSGFSVLLDSPAALAVLARPSWWTLRNTLAGLGVLAIVTLAVLGWVVVLQKQARRAEERARILFSAIPHPAYVFDLKGLEFLEVNDMAVEHYGYSRDEFLDMKVTDIRSAAEAERLQKYLREGRWEESAHGQWQHRLKNGRIIDVEITRRIIEFAGRPAALTIAQDVTERKRAEAENLRLATAIEQAAEAVLITDAEGITQFVNPAFTAVTGYSASEALGQNQRFLKSGCQDETYYEDLWKTIQAGQTWRGELVNRRKDGSFYSEEMTITPVRDAVGAITSFIAIKQDVTERKKAEEVLRQNEETFRLLFSDHPLPMWVYDVGTLAFLEVNSTAVAQYGYSHEEFLGMRITDIRPPEDIQHLLEALARGRPTLEESGPWRHRLKDGRIIDVQITSRLLKWNGRNAALVVAQDVTMRQRAEDALRHSEERYRLLFERNLAGVFQAGEDGRMTACNEACARILGYTSRYELLNMPMAELIPDPEVARQVGERLATQKVLTDFEVRLKGNHGKAVWVIANVSLSKNRATTYEGTFVDITARKQAEEEVKQRTEELERSNADLEQFAYISSHDLQEPLRMVASFTQLLAARYQGKLDRDADEFIGFAVEGATRMQALINGLLSFARVKSRARELEPTDSGMILGRSLASLRAALKDAGANVTSDPLPTVLADDLQLEHLFQNLLSNALKFRGPDPPRIHVSARQIASEWIFSVKDNGIGIDPGYHERIFVMFQRLHTRQAYPGTGIGLSVCKRIVERHGGRIWVESAEGKGATFYFTIPEPAGARRVLPYAIGRAS